jgi:hypothetical protein
MSTRTLLFASFLLVTVLGRAAGAPPVPEAYSTLYGQLERTLDEELKLETAAGAKAPPGNQGPRLCTDLLVANSNRGEILLRPETLRGVIASLDAFRKLGVDCVKFALQYPLLRPGFPHSDEYLAFYRQVVAEAHQRGIKVMPHVSVVFADTPFSPMKGIYCGLTLEKFKAEYRDMVRLIARELKPDYLDLLTEPDTHAKLTGIRELNQPEVIADVVQNALQGWDHTGILCGAGSGSWSSPDFARAYVKIRELDYLAIHIYPINSKFLDNARQMARIARSAGKQAFIDESWLYKTERPGGGDNVAATADIFRQDAFSFWEPLDQKFMTLMFELARHEQVTLLSYYWSSFFYGNLDYSSELDRIPYPDLTRRVNQKAFAAIQAQTPNDLGKFFQALSQHGKD